MIVNLIRSEQLVHRYSRRMIYGRVKTTKKQNVGRRRADSALNNRKTKVARLEKFWCAGRWRLFQRQKRAALLMTSPYRDTNGVVLFKLNRCGWNNNMFVSAVQWLIAPSNLIVRPIKCYDQVSRYKPLIKAQVNER